MAYNTRVAIDRAVRMLALRPGDEVLMPGWHCGSEVDPLVAAGLKVTLYPVGISGEVDVAEVASRITPATRAVYMIHYFGLPLAAGPALRALCDTHGLRLIEDCALALLSGDPVGHLGDISLFCFYKFLPLEAGAALVINAPDLPDPAPFEATAPMWLRVKPILRDMAGPVLGPLRALRYRRRLNATTTPQAKGKAPDIPADYYFDPALREAALTRRDARLLRRVDLVRIRKRRRENWAAWHEELDQLPGLEPFSSALPEMACPQSFAAMAGRSRDQLAARLAARGIGASPWWAGYHRALDYSECPVARALKKTVISLPVDQSLNRGDIARIATMLRAFKMG